MLFPYIQSNSEQNPVTTHDFDKKKTWFKLTHKPLLTILKQMMMFLMMTRSLNDRIDSSDISDNELYNSVEQHDSNQLSRFIRILRMDTIDQYLQTFNLLTNSVIYLICLLLALFTTPWRHPLTYRILLCFSPNHKPRTGRLKTIYDTQQQPEKISFLSSTTSYPGENTHFSKNQTRWKSSLKRSQTSTNGHFLFIRDCVFCFLTFYSYSF